MSTKPETLSLSLLLQEHDAIEKTWRPEVEALRARIEQLTRDVNIREIRMRQAETRQEVAEERLQHAKVLSAQCFDEAHEECSGRYDLGDDVTGPCACRCHADV